MHLFPSEKKELTRAFTRALFWEAEGCLLHLQFVSANPRLLGEVSEDVHDTLPSFCGALGVVGDIELGFEGHDVLERDLPRFFEIGFVADEDDDNAVPTNLAHRLMVKLEWLERLEVAEVEDKDPGAGLPEEAGRQRTIALLAGRVPQHKLVLGVVHDDN
jgi:hypothetical protein